MLISGDLTLPDGLTPQQFLAQFFNIGFSDSESGYANIDAYSEDGKFIVSTLFDTIPGLTNGFVELTFSSSPLNTTTNAFREIQSIAIVDNDTGTRMDITLIQPVTFAAFSGEFDVGGGLEGFLDLLMPLTGPGFFLNHDGSPGDDSMEGFDTNDFLNGRFGNDFIFGRLGNDSISGGEGDDTLSGGPGNDTLTGGAGADTYLINPGDAAVLITDMVLGQDKLAFPSYLRDPIIDAIAEADDGSAILTLEDGTVVTVEGLGVSPQTLTLADVLLADLVGTTEANTLVGAAGQDTIIGLAGNDTITGNALDDFIDGGDGTDTAIYSGNQASYTLNLSTSGATITDRRPSQDGTDTLIDIEFLDFENEIPVFNGNPLDLQVFGGHSDISVADLESIIELYIAYFNRAPDAIGLGFWATGFAKGQSLEEMAYLFVDQDETRAKYPEDTTNVEFATSVYNNVLGRDPDQSGLDFWVGHLDSGALSRDGFILEFLGGVQPGTLDRIFLDNKTDIGAYYAVHKGMSDVNNASAAMAFFDGTQGSVDNAVAAIDGFYQDALDPNNGEFLMQVVGVLDDPFSV